MILLLRTTVVVYFDICFKTGAQKMLVGLGERTYSFGWDVELTWAQKMMGRHPCRRDVYKIRSRELRKQ